jgi:MYXO-CTERM domain-containing protein
MNIRFSQRSPRGVPAVLCLAVCLALPALGCSSTPLPSESTATDSGAISGTAVAYIATQEDGSTETQYFLRVGGNEDDERRLLFVGDPELTTGTSIHVWGAEQGDQIAVDRFEIARAATGQLGTSREALVNGAAYPARTFAFVRVDTSGTGAGVTSLDEATATKRLFGTAAGDASVKQYYLEVSYGRQDITGSVVGPLTYTMTGCDTANLARALRPMVPGTFDHYLWYIGTNNPACAFSGLAQIGSPDSPARDTWYNASSGCVVLVQEPGHNFGMQHSSRITCAGTPLADDPSTCTHDEYGDRYDPMGGGCRHTNVWQKAYQGWFGGCNSVHVNQSGTFNLLPTETPCDGIQVLQIPMPKQRTFTRPAAGGSQAGTDTLTSYYLELRTKVGFDLAMTNAPTVLVHVGGDYRTLAQGGRHTWIMDMNPATTAVDGLGAGASYTDPAGGVTFSVQSLSATGASIQVTTTGTTASTCIDTTSTLVGSGPTGCGVGSGGGPGIGGATGAGGAGTAGSGTIGAGGTGGRAGAGGQGNGGRAGASNGTGGSGASTAGGGPTGTGGGPTGTGGATSTGSGGSASPLGGGTGSPTTPGGSGAATNAASGNNPAQVTGGCSCRVASAPASGGAPALGLVALVLVGALRRRRSALG